MKKLKMLLPVLAFLFAVVAAFATTASTEGLVTTYAFRQQEQCTECEPEANAEQICSPEGENVCHCMNSSEELRSWVIGVSCEILKKD